eukprot:TRINITY_DN56761_c0_g1_i1.p2 TRINITY_DN56761_c0_g1~~TRINITY_DN56761_c0_g1_i1.p2  ORF type:complete len:145 (-),score=11.98 TRINITY_DN56761_c0_g1_i1:392-826(-)
MAMASSTPAAPPPATTTWTVWRRAATHAASTAAMRRGSNAIGLVETTTGRGKTFSGARGSVSSVGCVGTGVGVGHHPLGLTEGQCRSTFSEPTDPTLTEITSNGTDRSKGDLSTLVLHDDATTPPTDASLTTSPDFDTAHSVAA